MASVFHLLIGCPASGKSTLAAHLHQAIPQSQIISTDQIREELFGDASKQGDWALIQEQVFTQIQQAISDGKQIIYDATNAKKAWRINVLKNLKKFDNLQVIGWYLETPLEICHQRNKKRQKQVPEDIIQAYFTALEQYPPSKDEGFTGLCHLPYNQLESINFSELESKWKN